MTGMKPPVEQRPGAVSLLITWLPRVALAIIFSLVGALKFSEHSVYVRIFESIGLGQWFRYLTGVI